MKSYEIDLHATLFCGQCFNWHDQSGVYQAVVQGRYVECSAENFAATVDNQPFLRHYFDVDWEYAEARRNLSALDTRLASALEKFWGIHILRQDPFEVLICFILSQNNTIARIRKLYATLCREYGQHIEGPWYAFPTAQQMAGASEEELRSFSMGFRAPYLVDAVAKHGILEQIPALDFHEALQLLMTIRGVGPKVGNCILLYGFHRMEAFPMDTWMQKVMKAWFPGKDSTYFAPYAGLAQQYLFHYARTEGLS